MLTFQIAELALCLDAGGTDLEMTAPPTYVNFLWQPPVSNGATASQPEPCPSINKLLLKIHNVPAINTHRWHKLLHKDVLWELWRDEAGRFIFVNLLEPGYYWSAVDADFSHGEVIINHPLLTQSKNYPLQSMDLRIYVNWLGNYGDALLHASCVVLNGEGYCFVGQSGAGKSTLAKFLKSEHGFVVLGEDHVVLRYISHQFWVFGTPWHVNAEMCSPIGVPLKKVFFLDRDLRPGVSLIQPIKGITWLLQTAFIPYYRPEIVDKILGNFSILGESTPFYSLSYPLGTNAWELIDSVN